MCNVPLTYNVRMTYARREFLRKAFAPVLAAAMLPQQSLKGAVKGGMPGPWPGRVIAVEHAHAIENGLYREGAIKEMMTQGMTGLTGAPAWAEAWRTLFEKGDVVGIKVSPVGGPTLCSDALVLRAVLDGLAQAGVGRTRRSGFSIVTKMSFWRLESTSGSRKACAGRRHRKDTTDTQLDMGGYAADQYMEMALIKPGENANDAHFRRSYVAKVVTKDINKFINLPVLKHHQSAGVTICLKNMSHGMVNNVNRSHMTPTQNACGVFIPSVLNLPVMRQKATLHICDGVKASFHGGPSAKPAFIWEHKTMYFATDPVALDKTGWKAIDAETGEEEDGSGSAVETGPGEHLFELPVEHIEFAGALGLGEFDDKQIDVRRVKLS